jgi:predicted dehydrogenase
LADPEIQVIHIVTPTAAHFAQASQAIAAGKHIVCEKPLTTTSADAARLVTQAATAGVVGTVAFTYRYQPVVQETKARLRDGELGGLTSIRGGYLQDWLLTAPASEWRLDPDRAGFSRATADLGSHLFDLVEFVCADRFARVAASVLQAVGGTGRTDSADDAVGIVLETTAGVPCSLAVSQVAPGHVNSLTLEVSGVRAAFGIDIERTDGLSIATPGSVRIVPADELGRGVALAGFTPQGGTLDLISGFSAFIQHSYAAMGGEPVEGLPTLADGLRAVMACEAVRRAAVSGAWVELDGRRSV